MKPLLVGESNPYQDDEAMAMRYALHPDPPRASGGRLCFVIMGLDERTYLASYDRTDLCFGKWSMPAARRRAAELIAERSVDDVIVLCGAKVAVAFGQTFDPFRVYYNPPRPKMVVIPHPSGLNRLWHTPAAVWMARATLRQAGLPVHPHDARCYLERRRNEYACVMECPQAQAAMNQRLGGLGAP